MNWMSANRSAGACFVLWIVSVGLTTGQFDANFTLQNVWGRLQSDARSIIQCLSDDSHKKIKFSRKLDTGQGPKLPKQSQQFMQGKPVFARILFMPTEDQQNRVGVFQCRIVKKNVATEIVTLKLPPSTLAELDAVDPYTVASIGDNVELHVNITKRLELTIKWRFNGVEVGAWDDQTSVAIHDVQATDAGVYECFYEGRRSENVHALMRLIVRSCPTELYGSKCDQECIPCFNGGICHDKWGVCVCPAGFTGLNCEIACGGNRFGPDCSKFCSPPQNNSKTDELCASHLFCKPDPYGCSCAPGFKGESCMEHCEPGWYGADCKQPCHCAYGISACNRITGACDGGCARGWRGSSCQIEDPNANSSYVETTTMVYCSLGSYGPSCERVCRCSGNEHCHVVTGHCPTGCEEGWGGPSCGVCKPGRFGENCESSCHCEGGPHNCDKDGFCHSGCEAGWAGFTCQAECTPGRFGPNCASTCHCHENSTSPCDKITGVCEGDCEPGYQGEDCQTLCPPNSFGINCVFNCTCVNGGHCNRIDGTCSCDGRWKGSICNESEPQVIAATDEEVNTGQQVFISCTADAVPEPVLNISSSDFLDLDVIPRPLGGYQYQAVVKIKPAKAGQYEFMCTARNQHGFDMRKIIMTVIDPPRLLTSPWLLTKTNHSLTVGWKDWEFSKDEGGSGTDEIEYLVVYREKDAPDWEKADGWSVEMTNTVAGLTPNTLYEVAVKCRRLLKGGEGDASPVLAVRTECGTPTPSGLAQDVLPTVISHTTVILTWKKPFEGPLRCTLTGYFLSYHPEADNATDQSIELAAEAVSAHIEGLSPNTVYNIRLKAVTAVERSKYFVELTLKTSEAVPDAVAGLESHHVEDQPDALLVTWEAPSEVNGAIRGYVIAYALLDRGHCGGQINDTEDRGQILSDTTEVMLHNLHPYSTYNLSVQAKTAAGLSDPSSISADTMKAAPDEPPENVRLLSSSSRSLTFGWDAIRCEYANGVISHYEYMVVVRKDIYPLQLKQTKRSLDVPFPESTLQAVRGQEVEVKNLQPDTEYGFMVRGVVVTAGGGPLSDISFHRTKEDVPEKPENLVVISTSAHSIGLSWSEPEISNGLVTHYRIQLWDHEHAGLAADVMYNVTEGFDDRLTTAVDGLQPATDFFIQIQAATSAGWGEYCSPISGRTLDGIPTEPQEISIVESGLRSLELTWKEPSESNGIVLSYKVRYRPKTTLDPVFNATLSDEAETWMVTSSNSVTLIDLHPSTEYSISVAARTSAGYGPEASIKSWTVILGDHVSPSLKALPAEATNETIPIVFSTTGSSSVFKYQVIVEDFRNKQPINESALGDYETAVVQGGLPYYIAAELDPRNLTNGNQTFVVGDGQVWGGYYNVHLNPGFKYKIRIRTLVFKDKEIKSMLSEPQHETAGSTIQEEKESRLTIAGFDIVEFILILVGLFVFLIISISSIIVAVCVRRRRKKSSNSLTARDSGISGSLTWSVMYKSPDSDLVPGPFVPESYRTFPLSEKHTSLKRTKSDSKIARGLRIEALEEYLANGLATNQIAEEFKRLVDGQTAPWTIARKSANLKKNRYGNILPYDRHRVVLHTGTSKGESDYINASYIDGYKRPREYIITQGPLDTTVGDFWRMVWQENCPVIVMVTDLVENGKKKCAKYWPEDSVVCGDIQILLINSEENTDFVVRTMLMRKGDEIRTHRVLQYQFTAWSDRTVPLNTNYFIKFLRRVHEDHPLLGGPMIVHCSAGTGRSGTYVAIDALYQQAVEDRRVEIFRFVNNARHQRIHLVQTLEQYIFIYEALVEAIYFEDTTVPLDRIKICLKELDVASTLDQRATILRQFNKLNRTQKKVAASRCSVALSELNIFKNRDPMTVPMDAARVRLKSEDQTEVGDYINAVFVDGYREKSAYLVTQMPLVDTMVDFWRMVYQHKSPLIVMLNELDEKDIFNSGLYWPEVGEAGYGEFDVQLVQIEDKGDHVVRILRLKHAEKKDDEPLKVVQLQYKGWGSELKPTSMIRLIQVEELWMQDASGGPVTVHCMDGATRSGLFVASKNVYDQVRTEKLLDVYQVVKAIRVNRVEFIPNSDQYRFLFELAQEVAESMLQKVQEVQPTKKISFKI